MIKGEKTEQRAKQKEEPLSHLSCGPSAAALSPSCVATLSSWAWATGVRVDVAAELPSLGGDG